MNDSITRILEAVAAGVLLEIIKIAIDYLTGPKDK